MQLYSNKFAEAGGVKRPEPTHLRSGDAYYVRYVEYMVNKTIPVAKGGWEGANQ